MSEVEKIWQGIHQQLAPSKQVYEASLKNTEQIQKDILLTILKNNEQSYFGKNHHFSKINNIAEYVQRIPVHEYKDFQPYIDELANQSNSKPGLICFEKTGGSTQGVKLIPYSVASLALFQAALFPWFDDLLEHRPNIKKGTAYWSISPAMRANQTTKGGHPIGLSNDALYFGESLAIELSQTLEVTPGVAQLDNISDWRYHTLLGLLLAKDLSFISVWSPTFLITLIKELPLISQQLLNEIEKQDKSRASYLRPFFAQSQSKENHQKINTQAIWPKLDTISCWTEGSAGSFISELKMLFPDVYIQGKGLLATEGVVTIPLYEAQAPVLAISSGFYEFMNDQGDFLLAHQLEVGKRYSVLLTNESGLYRYNLGDKVRMEGNYLGAPMLRFMGRGTHFSDLCGEKLVEDFIVDVFETFSNDNKAIIGSGSIHFIYPEKSLKEYNSQPHYVLVSEVDIGDASCRQLDDLLCENPQYLYARNLGQLGELQHRTVKNIGERYTDWRLQKGQDLGDIKPPALITDTDFIQSLGPFL